MGEDLQVMKEMWLGAAALGRREGRRGREREKLGECINLGYLPLPDRGMIVMAGGERRHGRLRRVRDLAWTSRESSREVRGQSASAARDTLITLQDTTTMMCALLERGDRVRVPAARWRPGPKERAVVIVERQRRGRRGGHREVPPVHRYVQSRLGRRRRVEGARRRRCLSLGLG